jgi:hypothetical protein
MAEEVARESCSNVIIPCACVRHPSLG